MSDEELVKRLREWDYCWPTPGLEHNVERAADAIERLTRERDALFESAQKCSQKLSVMFNERDAFERKVERLREALEDVLLDVTFMIEREIIPDIRSDIIYERARAALEETSDE